MSSLKSNRWKRMSMPVGAITASQILEQGGSDTVEQPKSTNVTAPVDTSAMLSKPAWTSTSTSVLVSKPETSSPVGSPSKESTLSVPTSSRSTETALRDRSRSFNYSKSSDTVQSSKVSHVADIPKPMAGNANLSQISANRRNTVYFGQTSPIPSVPIPGFDGQAGPSDTREPLIRSLASMVNVPEELRLTATRVIMERELAGEVTETNLKQKKKTQTYKNIKLYLFDTALVVAERNKPSKKKGAVDIAPFTLRLYLPFAEWSIVQPTAGGWCIRCESRGSVVEFKLAEMGMNKFWMSQTMMAVFNANKAANPMPLLAAPAPPANGANGATADGSAPSPTTNPFAWNATFEQSVEMLVNPTFRQVSGDRRQFSTYLSAHLLYYPIFATAPQLLEALLARYRRASDSGTGAEAETARQVRLGVFKVLRDWLDAYFDDFDSDPQMLKLLQNAVSPAAVATAAPAGTPDIISHIIGKIMNKKQAVAAQPQPPSQAVDSASPPPTPKSLAELGTAAEFAERFTLMEHTWFVSLKARQFIEEFRGALGSVKPATPPAKFSDELEARLDRVKRWVTAEVLRHDDVIQRAKTIEFFIDASQTCRSLKNFNGFAELMHGLSTPAVQQLRVTWDQVSTRHRGVFDSQKQLLWDETLEGYRSELRAACAANKTAKTPAACIPFVLCLLGDIHRALTDVVAEGAGGRLPWKRLLECYDSLIQEGLLDRQLERYGELEKRHGAAAAAMSSYLQLESGQRWPDMSTCLREALKKEPRQQLFERLTRLDVASASSLAAWPEQDRLALAKLVAMETNAALRAAHEAANRHHSQHATDSTSLSGKGNVLALRLSKYVIDFSAAAPTMYSAARETVEITAGYDMSTSTVSATPNEEIEFAVEFLSRPPVDTAYVSVVPSRGVVRCGETVRLSVEVMPKTPNMEVAAVFAVVPRSGGPIGVARITAPVGAAEATAKPIGIEQVALGEPLGKGALGLVHAGKFAGVDVAVKQFDVDGLPSWEVLRELVTELLTTCKIAHPNLVRIEGSCLELSNLCVVMQRAAYGSLFSYLAAPNNTASADWRLLLKIALDAARGVFALHQMGMLHKNLHPGNVLVTSLNLPTVTAANVPSVDQVNAVISDFGLSALQALSPQLDDDMTVRAEVRLLKAAALSVPEVLSGSAAAYSQKSDVFSFAWVLWLLAARALKKDPLTGLLPGKAATANDVAAAVATGRRPDFGDVNDPDLQSFVGLMIRCWEAKPEARPSFEEIVDSLAILWQQQLQREERQRWQEAEEREKAEKRERERKERERAAQESALSTHSAVVKEVIRLREEVASLRAEMKAKDARIDALERAVEELLRARKS